MHHQLSLVTLAALLPPSSYVEFIPETRDEPLSSELSLGTTVVVVAVVVTVVVRSRYYGSGVGRRRRVCSISNCK
jgi:hypothetical protein